MKKMKNLLKFMLAILIISTAGLSVSAVEFQGSISVQMTYEGKAVSGGTLTLLNINELNTDSSNAEQLLAMAKEQGITGLTQDVASDGRLVFSNLPDGTYLLYQQKAAPGFSKIAPFLVTLPAKIGDKIYYQVDASPKIELEKEPTVPEEPGDPKEPDGNNPGEKLPQTGQLNWPVPALTIAGLLLFAIGWYLCYADKGEGHEA